MDADELQQAMQLADTYAMKRARCAAYPFTTEAQERAADEACDNARVALQLFLASGAAGVNPSWRCPDCCGVGGCATCNGTGACGVEGRKP